MRFYILNSQINNCILSQMWWICTRHLAYPPSPGPFCTAEAEKLKILKLHFE